MFIPYVQIARDLRAFENSLSGLYLNLQKAPIFIESCKAEIERAKTEEEGEKQANIIKAHQDQINEHEREMKNSRAMIENMLKMREEIKDTYFSGWRSIILFFIR